MKTNAVPFLLLPGIGLIGYLVGEWSGAALALAAWCVVVFVGTVVHVTRHKYEEAQRDAAKDGNVRPYKPSAHAIEH